MRLASLACSLGAWFGQARRPSLPASALIAAMMTQPVSSLEMSVDGTSAILSGKVVRGDYLEFERLLGEHPEVSTIVLVNSSGGYNIAGFRISALIRARRLDTLISGRCVSACAIIFSGGVERRFSSDFPDDLTFVGIHGPHDPQTGELRDGSRAYNIYSSHFGPAMDDGLLRQAVLGMKLPNDLLYFFPPSNNAAQTSVFLCQGVPASGEMRHSPRIRALRDCAPRASYDALKANVITSADRPATKAPGLLRLQRSPRVER
jgi:hypothetical protein